MLLVEAAVVEGRLGDLKTAERLLEKAVKLDPGNADGWYNLAQAARDKNQIDRAVRLFRKSLALDPNFIDAAFGLGEALYVQGKGEEALPWLERACGMAPNDAEILHVKALCLDHLGKVGDALDAYRQVLRLQPDHVNASLNLAALTAASADPLEAVILIQRLEASAGVPPAGYAVAARVLQFAGEHERALAYADKAIAAEVDPADARLTRAGIFSDAGDFDAAEAELRKALEIKADMPGAYYHLALIKRLEPGAERPLLRQAKDGTSSASARAAAYFALYHLRDQAGDHERAVEMLAAGNAVRSGEALGGVAQRHEAYCARIKTTYSPELIAEQRLRGFDRPGPIFIFGMPRSGTTLTEQILSAHPDVLALGERLDVNRAVASVAGWPETAAGFEETTLQGQGRQVYDSMFAGAGGRAFATDKTPGNYMMAGAIACMLPQAKLVYVRRSPGDNALSLFEQSFFRGLDYSYDLGHIGAVYRAHLELMDHWTKTCSLPVHTVDYDLLVQDPETHIRRLLAFIGLEFRAECLAPHRVERKITTSSLWQVRQPISAKSVGRWRRYEAQLQPFFQALEGA